MFLSGIAVLTAPDHARLRLIWSDNKTPDAQLRRAVPKFVMACYPEAVEKSIKLLRDPNKGKHFKTLIAEFDLDVHHSDYRENKYNVDEMLIWQL